LTKPILRRLRKQDVPITIFFCITIISVGLIILPIWNYISFYRALGEFDFYASQVTLFTSQINNPSVAQAMVNVTILIINPTSYSGLKVSSILFTLYYIGPTETVTGFEGRSYSTDVYLLANAGMNKWVSIGPYSNKTIPFDFSFSANGPNNGAATTFLSYLANNPSQVQWIVSCNVFLNSFLSNPEISNNTVYFTSAS